LAELKTSEFAKTIGARLSRAIALSPLTRTDLAKLLGVHRNTISRVERGQDQVSLELLSAAFEALGYTFHDAMSGQGGLNQVGYSGIEPLDDAMIKIYNERSDSGVENLGRYVADDYRSCSANFKLKTFEKFGVTDYEQVYSQSEAGFDLLGLSYAEEKRLNKMMGEEVWLRLKDIQILTPSCIAVYFVRCATKSSEKKQRSFVTQRASIDYLQLANPIRKIKRSSNITIVRKQWYQLRDNMFDTIFATNKKGDFSGAY
tara:strand:+ start:226 stop:1002 length:777 start_codon:yes stop_codon:yes gene_type:complete